MSLTQGYCIIDHFVSNICVVLETGIENHLLFLPAEHLKETPNKETLPRCWKFLTMVKMYPCLHDIQCSENLFLSASERSWVPRSAKKSTSRLAMTLDESWDVTLAWPCLLGWLLERWHWRRTCHALLPGARTRGIWITFITPTKLVNYLSGHWEWKHRQDRTLHRQEDNV